MFVQQQRDVLAPSRSNARPVNPLAIIGANIRAARREAGWAPAALAARLRTAVGTLTRYERGGLDIPAHVLVDLARTLKCPVDRLFEGLPR